MVKVCHAQQTLLFVVSGKARIILFYKNMGTQGNEVQNTRSMMMVT